MQICNDQQQSLIHSSAPLTLGWNAMDTALIQSWIVSKSGLIVSDKSLTIISWLSPSAFADVTENLRQTDGLSSDILLARLCARRSASFETTGSKLHHCVPDRQSRAN